MAGRFIQNIRSGWRDQWGAVKTYARSEAFRELLLWCLPALVIGGVLRGLLIAHFPYGYMQADTGDYLITTERLLRRHALVLHGKKSFLTPILFTIPFLLHIPALIIVPLAQHLLGMILTVIAGALTRAWFAHWKWFIIPATVLTTINPAMIWYEHALLAEAHYIFCVMTLALAGTAFALRPTTAKFVWLLVALFFTAGSRPEGKLYVAFGILLVALVYWGNRREWLQRMAITLVACGLIWMSSRSEQAGLLLYATVLPLAPNVSKVAPDFSPVVNPLRDQYIAEGPTVLQKLTTAEKTIWNLVRDYARGKGEERFATGAFCQKLAVEAAMNKPFMLVGIAANKFLMSCKGATSGGYSDYWVQQKQIAAFTRKDWLYHLSTGLTGRPMRTKEDVVAFVQRTSPPLNPDWFEALQHRWSSLTLHKRLPDRQYPSQKVQGLSYFFLISFFGFFAALLRPGRLWRFHVCWVLTLFGVWFAVLLTGVVNPRYRFVFEPFCILYALFFFDTLWSGGQALLARSRRGA